MQKGTISVQTENIFPIIKKFLYADQEIFLRELVSNAVDATTKCKVLAQKGELKDEFEDTTIEIILDEANKTLTIRDHGIGMTEEEVIKYLNQIAFSSAREWIEKFKNEVNIIGNFGLGFYSAFMVAEKVEVKSKSWKEGSDAVLWTCDGSTEYTLEKTQKNTRGTDVILYIGEDGKEFLDKNRIEELLVKYCKFLPFPIKFGTREETIETDPKSKEKKTVEVDNIINNTAPAWKKQPSELSDEDYKNFYRELYPFGEEPLFWIHLNIDYPFNLTGILFFPKLKNALEFQKNKIQLYSNQVFVTDDVKEIVPEWLTLLHGVIDSPDIPLNVSRSYLQSDSNVRKITGYITKKIADKLQELFKQDRKNFESKWNEVGVFVKYGMLSDEKFYEKAQNFVLLKNTENEFFTIEEYKKKVEENQKDKSDKIIFLYTNNTLEHDGFVQNARSAGYDVLIFDQITDNHFIHNLEFKQSEIAFRRVDSDTLDNLVKKEEVKTSVLSEKEQATLKEAFEKVLSGEKKNIELKPLSPEDAPVQIVKPEFLRRMKEMQTLSGMDWSDFPETVNVVVNSNHPVIAQKIMESEESAQNELIRYLYDLALLQQNMLKGADLTAFTKKALTFLK